MQEIILTKILNDWDVSNVTDMELMFQARNGYYSNFNQPLNNWDVSKVTNMRGMFGTYSGDGKTVDVISIKI